MSAALAASVDTEWLRCRPWIEAALEYTGGTHTILDVEIGLATNKFQFFSSTNSAVVTEFLVYPQKTIFNYWLIGGDLKELIVQIEPYVSAWAKQKGAHRVVGIGRRGFERAFRGSGFKPLWTAIAKDL